MSNSLLSKIATLNEDELRRELTEILTRQKLGLVWEHSAIERDRAANQDVVLPRLDALLSHGLDEGPCQNLIIEGDNFDSLRLLRATHRNKIRVIYIDPPYNTGNKDWVYNDDFVGKNDRWRHSQWLEFLYQRLVLARDLLTPDGVIMVSINDENRSRLELLMDEVFPGMRLGSIVWRTRQGSNADQKCFLSVDHEHLLVYGNSGFSFSGFNKSYDMYSNTDNDPRGDWRTSDLTLGFSYKERPNLYYPIVDGKTGIHYPPNPDRIWVYATEERLKPGQTLQANSMEEFIRRGQIIFPENQRVETWNSMSDLLKAIDAGDVPKTGRAPILRRDLPNLEQWIGKPVGFGRPQFKRFKADLRNQTQPLSSWIVPSFDEGTYEADSSLISATNQEGAKQVAAIFGDRVFNYAKPVSLIKGLLSQASRPGDIVLDFFAGSGTTGQAVLDLNAEDGGSRRFILCSSTEATQKTSRTNVCRDITAERIRRVMTGYGSVPGLGGRFAYLTMDKFDPADVELDAGPSNIRQLLALRLLGSALPDCDSEDSIDVIASTADVAAVYIPKLTQVAIEEASKLRQPRLLVFSDRPDTARELLTAAGKTCDSRPIGPEIAAGQAGAAATQFAPQEAK